MRLFVAMELPGDIRSEIGAFVQSLRPRLRHAKWVETENLHITLLFLGEVPEEQKQGLEKALSGVHHGAFDISVEGLGFFPRRARVARVLWIGVGPGNSELVELADKVRQALLLMGIRDDKPFHPHITIARARRGVGIPTERLRGVDFRAKAFRAGHFSLMRSQLRPGGPVYTRIKAFPFT